MDAKDDCHRAFFSFLLSALFSEDGPDPQMVDTLKPALTRDAI